ncbi:hypothetical protein LJB81_04470 [Desulfovibrio sp. OttesenSCG-928-M14]|nr:hypothetical protein [Desulfovibrio sp. OttesenSCG-928-M14]
MMKSTPLIALALCLILCPVLCAPALADSGPPVPRGLETLALACEPDNILEAFLGLPYRPDGAVNEAGEYSLFAARDRRFDSPGLNCSGLVLAAVRFLFNRNISLDEAVRDRLGDSGPGAPMGQDWDFGWDLILNVSEGLERRFLLPGGQSLDPAAASGIEPLGWDLNDKALWRELPPCFRPGHVYLISMSMQARTAGYGLQHYHLGLAHVDSLGRAWFYQTTGRGGAANRRDLNSAKGRASFMRAFASGSPKKILVLEVRLP